MVDTTVLVDIERGRNNIKKILENFSNQDEIFAISAITLRELFVGIGFTRYKLGTEASIKKVENIQKICNDFNIIDVSQEIFIRSGEKEGELIAKGISIGSEDIIIGITAELMKASLIITRNPGHFSWSKVKILSYARD